MSGAESSYIEYKTVKKNKKKQPFPLVAVNLNLWCSFFHIFRPQELGHILAKLVWKLSIELTWLIEWLRIILGRSHLLSLMALVLVCLEIHLMTVW